MTDSRTLVLSWLRTLTRGKPSDAVVTIPVSELLELEEQVRDAPRAKRVNHRKARALTSRSKLHRPRNSDYLAFVRNEPCCGCSTNRNVEAHHTGRKADKAMGRKPPDELAVPLDDQCHRYYHDHGHLPGLSVNATQRLFASVREHLQKRWAERNNQGEEF